MEMWVFCLPEKIGLFEQSLDKRGESLGPLQAPNFV